MIQIKLRQQKNKKQNGTIMFRKNNDQTKFISTTIYKKKYFFLK